MRVSNSKAGAAIAAAQPFDNQNSTLGGRTTFIGWGELPADVDKQMHSEDVVAFWVYSYDTPIAWQYDDGSWFMPPVRYSATTSQHQYIVADAIGYDGSW